jgi:hypothetical protein
MKNTRTKRGRLHLQALFTRGCRNSEIILVVSVVIFLLSMGARPHTKVHSVPRAANESNSAKARVAAGYGRLSLSFEPNRGQTTHQVKFLSRGAGYTVFLTKNSAVLELKRTSSGEHRLGTARLPLPARNDANQPMTLLRGPAAVGLERKADPPTGDGASSTGAVVRLRLINASPAAKITGIEKLPGKSNYLIGNDPKKWRTDVPNYAKVKYRGVYPGVDLVYYGNQRQLEYDFVVAPGADPATIRLGIDARNSKIEIAKNGDLVIQLGEDDVRFRKPVVYQVPASIAGQRQIPDNLRSPSVTRHFLDGRYVLLATHEVGFEVADYDKTQPLVIDPVLAYSTYLGGTGGGADGAADITTDSSGSVYVTGATNSDDFPTTTGSFQETLAGGTCRIFVTNSDGLITIVTSYNCSDVFVSKLNAAGTALVYSTYIGGTAPDAANGIAVDSTGSAYLTGSTSSTDFPTVNPFQATGSMAGDAFVTKLNAAGNGLVYSTYLSGSRGGQATGIAVDSAGSTYVTGWTRSTDFPTTSGALEPTFPDPTLCTLPSGVSNCLASATGCTHTFAVKLSPAGSAALYSTYLGGGCDFDTGQGIAVDSSGNAYIAGSAYPAGTSIGPGGDFPTTAGAYQPSFATAPCNGGFACSDAFVAKLNSTGSALVYSTLLGGTASEGAAGGIALGATGNVYLAGNTNSTDFPTMNAFQATLNGAYDVFVAKLNADASSLDYSTYLGGSGGEASTGIAVDFAGSAYVTGTTNSADFPVMNATQAAPGGLGDAFVAKLNAAGNALDFSTYLGGSGIEGAAAISLDAFGNAYVTGWAGVGNFPITPSALQPQGPSTTHCVNWPSGYVPFTQITSQTSGLVVGLTTPAAYQELLTFPLPTFTGEGFCTPAELAPGQYFVRAADPTQAERDGVFTDYGTIIDPITGQPLAGNIIPPSELGMFFAWPVNGLLPPSDPFVVKISGFPAPGPTVTLSPDTVDFGSVAVSSSSSTQTVTFSNSGSSTVTITGISITGADSGDFSQSNTCGDSLATGSDCTISVTFTPTIAGSRGALLTVSDDAASSPQMAALSGTGQDFVLEARTTNLTIAPGASANYDLVLSPQAGFAQTVDLSCSGAPANSTCTANPTSITLDGANDAAFKLTVSTSGSALVPPADPGNFVPPTGTLPLAAWLAVFSLLGLIMPGWFIPKGERFKRLAPLATLALLVTLWAACGGGPSPSSSSTRTPAGTYTLTVTGASGSLSHSTTVSLTVQ